MKVQINKFKIKIIFNLKLNRNYIFAISTMIKPRKKGITY